MIVQKYHSIFSIDEEFSLSLEELLSNDIPRLEVLKIRESRTPKDIHFVYYLFFEKKSNTPIAFARACIYTLKQPGGKRFFIKSYEKVKHVYWSFGLEHDTCAQRGFCISPGHELAVLKKLTELINEFDERTEVKKQRIIVEDRFKNFLDSQGQKKLTISLSGQRGHLLKGHSSYESYIQGLDKNVRDNTKKLWKDLYTNLELRIGEYPTLKDAFAYKSKGNQQYRKLLKEEKLKFFIENSQNFLSLETPQAVHCLIFIMQNVLGHMFFYHYALDEDYSEEVILQVAIMHFYEQDDTNKLSSFIPTTFTQKDKELGFHERKLYLIEVQK